MTTPFERRLAKLEAERMPVTDNEAFRLVFMCSPVGMTDLADQEAWAAAQPTEPGRLVVHFVNCPPQPSDMPSGRLH